MLTVTRLPETTRRPCDACETPHQAQWEIALHLLYVCLCDGQLRRLLAVGTEALMQGEDPVCP